ncbi:lipoyl(octanoyl) transferase LipB [Aliivibrio logei]|uniref:lipoyl(octanoyl) transferase LipB n=1 Tax=Aliivibrio logei TaxID=688 RepID=UPI0035C89885
MNKRLIVKNLGRQDYEPVWKAMHTFTDERDENTCDEVWLVEHNPVFTQGQAGKEEHVLAAGNIPIVKSDRGGQVTYHGPGQLVAYVLINLRRKNIGVRELVTHIENTVINTLGQFNITSAARPDAPGVYVDNRKICSLGLRIRKGCSFHGLALNVNMDLSPFLRINPCGYAGMEMIQLHDLLKENDTVENKAEHVEDVHPLLIKQLTTLLDYTDIEYITESSHHE